MDFVISALRFSTRRRFTISIRSRRSSSGKDSMSSNASLKVTVPIVSSQLLHRLFLPSEYHFLPPNARAARKTKRVGCVRLADSDSNHIRRINFDGGRLTDKMYGNNQAKRLVFSEQDPMD